LEFGIRVLSAECINTKNLYAKVKQVNYVWICILFLLEIWCFCICLYFYITKASYVCLSPHFSNVFVMLIEFIIRLVIFRMSISERVILLSLSAVCISIFEIGNETCMRVESDKNIMIQYSIQLIVFIFIEYNTKKLRKANDLSFFFKIVYILPIF